MASSTNVDAFPCPCPNFVLDLTTKKPEKEKEKEGVAAATARMLEMYNSDRKRSLDENLESIGPNKKINVDKDDTAACDKAPKYPPHMKRKPVVIEEDKCLPDGVESFLCSRKKKRRNFLVRFSGERVPVTSLLGKHILICGFVLPLPTDLEEADVCRAMIASYPKLSKLHNYEMVMVAKMRDRDEFSNKEEEEAAFNHFFSAFPCLAVPFSDSRSRDFICSSLGLTHPGDLMASIIVDDQQVVSCNEPCEFFLWYGALFFPFTIDRIDALEKERDELKIRLDPIYMELSTPEDEIDQVSRTRTPLSLSELLGCQPSDLLWKCTAAWAEKMIGGASNDSVLRKCSAKNKKALWKCSARNEKVVVSVLDLSHKKLVGLYLCINGQFMARLYEVQQQCLARGLEFEIVLVFLPFFGDFTSFFHDAKLAIKKLGISSWWIAPYNDVSSRRLWQLCDRAWSDKLFVLDDASASKAGELDGRGVIRNLRGIEAYPFTKHSLVEKRLSRLRSITFESLFDESSEGVYNIVFRKQGPPFALHVSELKGKNILLYIEDYDPLPSSRSLCELLKQWYDEIKKAYPKSEVLFVARDNCYNCRRRAPERPWLHLHPSATGSVIKRLFGDEGGWSSLVAFGEDGLLRSKRADKHIMEAGVSDALFADSLREETIADIDDTLSVGDL